MSNFDFSKLNSEQKDALLQTEGAVLVTAGAGSGKTRLLTSRIAYLVEEKGIKPWNILAITFTNKAANEMKKRVAESVVGAEDMLICTFHSLCVRILRSNISLIDGYTSSFSIYDESDSTKILKQIKKQLNIEDDEILKKVQFHISNIKNNGYDIEEYSVINKTDPEIDTIVKFYNLYQESLKKNNALDFDDLQLNTFYILTHFENVRKKYQEKFKYILVDEFQDTNTIQYKLIKLLCHEDPNIFVVGDEDQCIYSWRGANFENIFKFKNEFDNVHVFKLQQNYRSTKKILEMANTIIKNNTTRLDKTLFTDNADGEDVKYYFAYDEKAEAEYVSREIKKLVESGKCRYSEIAVLTRLNALTFAFEERFLTYAIPYKIFGGFKFYERAEIKNVLSYLSLIANPNDEVGFLRVINFPKRGIGQASIDKLRDFANASHTSLFGACLALSQNQNEKALLKFAEFGKIYSEIISKSGSLKLDELAKLVIDSFKIKESFDTSKEEEMNKVMNIDSFISSVSDYVRANPDSTLENYLESVSLVSDIDGLEQEENYVKIATIHAVKGLEFKAIFVVGLEEGLFPVSRAMTSNSDLEEERRLAYVALTRAEQFLFLSCTKCRFMYGKRSPMIPSRFLTEIGISEKKNYQTSTGESVPLSKPLFNIPVKNLTGFVRNSQSQTPSAEVLNKDIFVFKANQKVDHKRYGNGKIISVDYNDKTADIMFDGFGKKTLMLEIAPLTILEG